MAIEQQTPDVSRDPIEALGPFTESELCKPVAVKLFLKELAAAKESNGSLLSQLQTEHGRNDTLTSRANNAETELRVLKAATHLIDKRDRIVRLIEFALVLLIGFMIDAARSSAWTNLVGLGIASGALIFAVALIQWWPPTPENK